MEPASSRRCIAEHEPRWHASLAVLAALLLHVTLPPKLTIGPAWVAPLLVLALLVPLSVLAPRRHAQTRRMRFWGILLIAIVTFFNVVSVSLLIAGFFHPARVVEFNSASVLLRLGAQVWLTNVLVFGLWFWELDGGGPEGRASDDGRQLDFLFPQTRLVRAGAEPAVQPAEPWRALFFDYLYLAFTNATAFSPADALPLSRRAKGLMLLESLISLATIAIVLARSVSLIE